MAWMPPTLLPACIRESWLDGRSLPAPDGDWIAWVGVDYRVLLNIRRFAHADAIVITADDNAGPHRDVGAQAHIAN